MLEVGDVKITTSDEGDGNSTVEREPKKIGKGDHEWPQFQVQDLGLRENSQSRRNTPLQFLGRWERCV
jgi:hypothetical protein